MVMNTFNLASAAEQPENRLQMLQELIENSPAAIESEFARTNNDWLACFGSRIFALETLLEAAKTKTFFSEEGYAVAQEKLRAIKEKFLDYKNRIAQESTSVPAEIKEDLLVGLNILG